MQTMVPSRSQWASRERLDDLLQRVTVCLQGLPGFRTLSLFGSMAEGRADGYSDLDMIVTTDDLSAAQQCLLAVLEGVGAVESCWVISLRPDEWNPTIIFGDEGYYHKLDLGLMASSAVNHTTPPAQTALPGTRPDELPSIVACESSAYMPSGGLVGHFLLGQFIGGIRYCKARKRGQQLTCYRFVSAAADWCLRTLYLRQTGEGRLGRKLSTGEYADLDRLDTDSRGRAILARLDYSTPEQMDQSLCHVLRHMHQLCQDIAATREEVLDDRVFQRILASMQNELDCPQ